MDKAEKKKFSSADDVREFKNGKMSLVTVGNFSLGKIELKPGWRWSKDLKPIVKTETCELAHKEYVISGRLHVLMNDGSEFEVGPGDVAYLPAGHDGWIVGNETYVALEFNSPTRYAVKA